MIPQNKIKQVIGKSKFTRYDHTRHPLRNNKSKFDTDKDGYLDMVDCKPRNKNEDGWISNMKERKEARDKAIKKARKKQIQDTARRQARNIVRPTGERLRTTLFDAGSSARGGAFGRDAVSRIAVSSDKKEDRRLNIKIPKLKVV